MRKVVGALAIAGLMSSLVLTHTGEASAQVMAGGSDGRISAFPQGTIGCGLLGMEAVMLIEGAAGLRNRWVMLGTGAIGLAAGVVGGIFLDHALDTTYGGAPAPSGTQLPSQGLTMISTATLLVGLGLVIPTTIVFASTGMYRPPAPTQQDNGPRQVIEESSGTPAAGGTSRPTSMRLRQPGMGSTTAALLNMNGGRFGMGMPGISVQSAYSMREMTQYGQMAVNELHLPLLAGTF